MLMLMQTRFTHTFLIFLMLRFMLVLMLVSKCEPALRGTKILFCGRGLKFFHPVEDINSKATLNTLRGTKSAF